LKKSILKIAVPTLALGLAFAPMASASPNDVSQKTAISVKSDSKSKGVVQKLNAKEKEAIKKLSSITKNLSKVEAKVNQLSMETTYFYAKAVTTPISSKVEAEFYSSTSGKLKANANQLKALKKQVDHVDKKYKNTDAVAASYKKISDLNKAVSLGSKNLTDLHNQFKTIAIAEVSKKQFIIINNSINKVEANIADFSKATVEFYAKAATDSTITSTVEGKFYSIYSATFKANTTQLQSLKKQLDSVAKYNDAVAVAAANKKISDLTNLNSVASKNLTDLHTQFKAKVTAEEAAKQFISINNKITNVEASVAELTKATVEFYAKAATDATVTAQVESNFYSSTSSKLKANTNQLKELKKQLDLVAKNYTDFNAVAVANKKISDLNNAISVTSKNLNDFNTSFKAKLKAEEAKKQLAPITDNISKVETSVAELTKATVDFYAKAAIDATVTAQIESNFYSSTSTKLKANTNQLKELKKKLDLVAKNYTDINDVAVANKKISDLNNAISVTSKNLNDFHASFKAKLKAEEAKKQLAPITDNISKVEASVAELTKATVDFYTKAATNSSVTIQVEAEFYAKTSGALLSNTKQLLNLKKQLDLFVKTYGTSVEVTTAISKINAQNKAIVLAVDTLTNFHTNFKPVPPTTTNP
jgi:myosin heavy subunit